MIGSFALQRRVIASYEDFPKVLRDAIISTEDKDFETHLGVNLWRMLGAAWRDMASGSRAQGASTLTMQLSRNLFLTPDRTFRRKIQEIMLSIQIERRFTKPQIFTLYCNQIFLGHGVYGFEAGAQYYFSKQAKDLTLPEAAMLAGLPKAPSFYSPINNPDRALRRRNLVINAMLEDGKITAEEAAVAKSAPIRLNIQGAPNSLAPYFVEEVRQYLEKKYGSSEVHEGGLRVYTSLDMDLQAAAKQAVLDGLAAYERRHGWHGSLPNVIADGQKIESYSHPDWIEPIAPGSYVHALVTSVDPTSATVKFGRYDAMLGLSEIAWTQRKSVAEHAGRRRHCLRQGSDPDGRGPCARLAGTGLRRAGGAAGPGQQHRRHQGDGRRPRLRRLQVQPRHPGHAAGGVLVQAIRLYRRRRQRRHSGRHDPRRAHVSFGPAPTRRTITTAAMRATSPFATPWRNRAIFRP